MARVVRRVDQMASPNRQPGYPKRKQGPLEWTPSRKPKYNIKPGTGLDGYVLGRDEIILE